MLPTALELWQMVSTFAITCFAWIFFRAASMQQAYDVLGSIASRTLFNAPAIASKRMLAFAVLGIMVTLALEWISREKQYGLQLDHVRSRPVRYALYYGVIAVIMLGAPLSGGEFIYFQF